MKIILSFLLVLTTLLTAEEKQSSPPRVVVIGGGPAGLAAALEAKQKGADAAVIEKRAEYTRYQWVFLDENSLTLLAKWNISLPEMRVSEVLTPLNQKERRGVVAIKHLEEQLEKRCQELGIEKIHGEFKGFSQNSSSLTVLCQDNEKQIRYDLAIGADGTHSQVRTSLGIDDIYGEKAFGVSALIPSPEFTKLEISEAVHKEDYFIRKITFPSASIIFLQSKEALSEEKFQEAIASSGWTKESTLLKQGKGFLLTDIPIHLMQANIFYNAPHNAVLIGDAAASASFFKGKGANTALTTAAIAGRLVERMIDNEENPLERFNQEMQEATDAMIEDSLFLFEKNA